MIDPLEPDEIRRVPRPLIKIALKAMHAESTQRYQSVSAFADDLKRYQAGLSVSAYRESPLEAFRRWYKRNRRLFWTVALFSAAVSGVGWLLLREKILEMVTWRMFYSEQFNYRTTGELAGNWTAYSALDWFTVIEEPFSDSSGWRMRDSALNGFGHSGFNNITFKRRIPGDIRVEWDITPIRRNLNLNCYIAGQTRSDGYTFHVASYGDPRVVVLTKGQAVQRLDNLTLSEGIKVGRRYRLRMEKEGQRVRLWLDGRKLFDYRDPDDISGPGIRRSGSRTTTSITSLSTMSLCSTIRCRSRSRRLPPLTGFSSGEISRRRSANIAN